MPGVDALVVSDLTNVRWLTGFTGSNGWLVVSRDALTLVTDGRYGVQAEQQSAASGVELAVVVGRTTPHLQGLLSAAVAPFARVGFEAANLTVAQHTVWSETFAGALVPTTGVVEHARRAKDDGEIALIAQGCRIADAALAEVAPTLRPGVTEAQVRNRLEVLLRELGASGPSYETIVAAGPVNAALPHHRPTDTSLADGDLVIIDVGALVDGYHSDMTRTFVVGEPSSQQTEMYGLVLGAQRAGLAAVAAGVPCREVDAACRRMIGDAGYGDWFSHGTGHGVGLLIHEEPYQNAVSEAVLQVGDVVTIEPGVYRDGFGGIRVEDLVVVTDDGCRALTAFPKDSLCPPSPPTI